MGLFYGLGTLWVVLGIAYFIGCLALGGWLASEKGYSVGSWVVLLILFGVLALIVLVGAPDRKNQISTEEQNSLLKKHFEGNNISVNKQEEFNVEKIVKTKTNVFKEQNLNSEKVSTLLEGEKVTLLEKGNNIPFVNDQWAKIRCENGTIGYCYISDLKNIIV
jgi:hypothetical protein